MNKKTNDDFKVNGIIAEYNPFHNGHKYQIEDAQEQSGADYTIVAMSGNFMQRGTPALLDKYKRAEMALRNGADLVLELPSFYAASSAEFFATGATALLDKLGVVDYLCFGSECGDIELLQQFADILLDEPEEFVRLLKANMRQGLSYPSARTNALLQYRPELSCHRDVLFGSNNILGIEYLKAIMRRGSAIKPITTLRVSSNHHDRMMGTHQSSALAIRQATCNQQNLDLLAEQMPPSAFEIYTRTLEKYRPVELNDFSSALQYKLLMEADEGYTRYLDVSEELSDRICSNLYQFKNFCFFCDLLKTKDMTYTRISRCLLHILLDIDFTMANQYKRTDYVAYARVLGFRRSAEPLLTAIKAHSSIPLLTKLADASCILDENSLAMLRHELRISSVYAGTSAMKSGQPMINEYRTPLVII